MTIEARIFQKLTALLPDLKTLRHRKMTAEGYMDLGIDVLERRPNAMRIALSHYYKHPSGDMIPDPDMELEVNFREKTARALTFQDTLLYQSVEDRPALQGELNRFLQQWLTNIEQQGFAPEYAKGERRSR